MFALYLVGLCALGAQLSAAKSVLHAKRDVPLQSWAERDRLHPEIILPVRIGLTQQNLDVGADLLAQMWVVLHNMPMIGSGFTLLEI